MLNIKKLFFTLLISSFLSSSFALVKMNLEENPLYSEREQLKKAQAWFLVEVPGGTNEKYEYRRTSGRIVLDRVLCPRQVPESSQVIKEFPANYGVIPGIFNTDGDPVDLMVLGNEREYKKRLLKGARKARKVRVIGLIKMQECDSLPCHNNEDWVNDWKVLGVDPSDQKYKDIFDITDLGAHEVKKLNFFWSNYKGHRKLKDGKWYPLARVTENGGIKEALKFMKGFKKINKSERKKEILACQNVYKEVIERKENFLKERTPPINKAFLSCLGRVIPKHFFKNQKDFSFYGQYSAYQFLKGKLKDKTPGLSLENSLKVMEKRKLGLKTYYRFVFKNPKGSLDNLLYDWIKTKNRRDGCLKGTGSQFYDLLPVVNNKAFRPLDVL